MKTLLFLVLTFTCLHFTLSQTTSSDGDYENPSIWVGNAVPESKSGIEYSIQNLTLNIQNLVSLGSFSEEREISAPSNSESSLIISGTLVVYGDFTVNQNGMDIEIEENARLIILGDFTMNNNTTINSAGLIAVKGDLSITGTNAFYNQTGTTAAVYADNYQGTTEAKITLGSLNVVKSFHKSNLNIDGHTEVYDLFYNNIPLPITLGSFRLKQESGNVALAWTTLTEENFDYFEIQRASSNGKFEVIGTIKGNGWSSDVINYKYIDNAPLNGLNIYRLESVDFDGYRETFPAKAINVEPINKAISFYPNELHGEPEIQLDYSGQVSIIIIDLNGTNTFQTSANDGRFELPSLVSGQYILKYQTEENLLGFAKLSIR